MAGHPNSMKNLTAAWNSETAKEASKLGLAKRKANKLAREQLKMSMALSLIHISEPTRPY